MISAKISRKVATIVISMALVVSFLSGAVVADAAEYTQNGAQLSITNGRAIYTGNDGKQVQLTRSLVTSDGVIASGTVYLLYMNGAVYFYSPKYSKGVTFLADGATTISESGYETTSSGHQNFPTEDEIKSKLGLNNPSGGNNGNTNTNNGTGTNNNNSTTIKKGINVLDKKTVIYNDGSNNYVISNDSEVVEAIEKDGVVYISYSDGTIKSWKVSTKGTAITLTVVASNTNTTSTTNQIFVSAAADAAQVIVSNSTGIVGIYNLSIDKEIVWAYVDGNGTIYIKNKDGELYVWNYELQKQGLTSNAIKVTTRIATNVTDPVLNNGKIIGYMVTGSTAMQPVWSLDQIKVAIAMATANTNNATNNNSSNSSNTNGTKADTSNVTIKRVITKNTYKFLYDSNGNEIDEIRLKNKVLYYGDMSFKGVKKVDFTKTGNIVFVKTNGKCYGLNTTTLKTKVLMSKNASHFCHNNSGFAVKIERKNGTKTLIKNF